MIINLTTVVPDKLVCPEGKRRIELVDTGRTGLYVSVTSGQSGYGVYYHRYRDTNGTTRHIKLGSTEDLTLEEAREKSRRLKAEIILGADPRAEDTARKAVPTFTAYMDEQYFPHVRTRKRTAAKDEEYYRLRLKDAFGRKRLNQITRREIQLFHSKLHADGLAPATCNHYLKLLKRAFNLAIQWEVIEGPNPAVGIQQYRELNQVENYLDEEQLRALLAVLKSDKNRTVCGIVLFLLSTGARLNEALQARWSLIDVENRVWRIPATNSKSGKMRAVPLNDAALEVLSRQDTEDEFEHVFINRQTGLPYTTIQKVWERLRKKAGLEHVRIHDLRHSYASMLVNSGRSLYEVQQILGHSNPKVTQRYSHLSTATLQDAAGSAAERISEALKKAS
jgi:integrase